MVEMLIPCLGRGEAAIVGKTLKPVREAPRGYLPPEYVLYIYIFFIED